MISKSKSLHTRLPSLNVLLLDDEEAVRRSLAYFLSTRGWKAFAHDHTADIVALVRDHSIDVIVADLRMPNITGLDLIEKLREAGMKTPAMILSASVHAIDRDRANRLGIFHVMEKPPDLKKLTAILVKASETTCGSGLPL